MRGRTFKNLVFFVLFGAMAAAGLWRGFGAGAGGDALAPSTVAIVRAERPSADDLTDEEIDAMVRRAVTLAGGLGAVVHRGDVVVVKPNLVRTSDLIGRGHPLPKLLGGVATDRRVVRAVVRLAHEAGAGKIYVMEGSSEPTGEAFHYYGYTPGNIPFADAIIPLEADSGGWQEYDSPKLARVDLADGRYKTTYYLNRRYYEADVVISVPTLKNHWDAAVTGAVKNLSIGATPPNIYGGGPTDNLRWPRIPHGNLEYHAFMRDFYKCKPAGFAVMDGLVGIQRGPTPSSDRGSTAYESERLNMRCILSSADPLALDTVEALIMGWDPATVKYLQYLGADGLGNADPAKIGVVGRKVSEVRKDFAGVAPSGGGATYSDRTPPEVKVERVTVAGNRCLLELRADRDTARIEVYIDDKPAGVFRRGFDRLAVDISALAAGKHRLRLVAFDRFLNDREVPVGAFEKVQSSTPK